MSAEYPHLHSATRPLADESAESRIRRIRTDRWITYSRAEAALGAMEDLLNFPKRTRMPNLLLVGPTNNGKTMMTFERLEPAYREDEDSGRFCGQRFDARAPQQRTYRFVVCGACLEDDATPYVRVPWLIGWMAVCSRHGTVLIERCGTCRARLRVAPFTVPAIISPATCTRCGASLLQDSYSPAHPAAARLQAALLRGKCEGTTDLEGLGWLTWKETVALADVLLGMVWTDLTSAERQSLFLRYQYESVKEPRQEMGIYAGRHDSLRFLAWLIEGWPGSEGAAVSRDLLERWLSGKPNRISHHLRPTWPGHPWSPGPQDIEPEIQNRLRELIV